MSSLDDEFAKFEAEMKAIEKANELASIPKPPVSVSEEKKKSKTPVPLVEAEVISAAPQRKITTRVVADDERHDYSNTSGALSGFMPGTSGATAHEGNQSSKPQSSSIRRVDMATGQPLSQTEHNRLAEQQSAYDYDPQVFGSSSNSKKRFLRVGGGEVWEDKSLQDWPENDFRLFIGDLGNEVTDELLAFAFSAYTSFQRSRVVRDKRTHKSKGFGFVSFQDPYDCAKAMREMNGKYIGNRPVKITKSKWQERDIKVARKKNKKSKKNHLFA